MSEPLELFVYPAAGQLPSISSVCTKVALALRRSGLEHRVCEVSGGARGTSPSGRLPALRSGERVLCDSISILDHLEELDPPQSFWPEEPRARARDRAWEHFIDDHLYWFGLHQRWCVPEHRERLLDELFGRGFMRLVVAPLVARSFAARSRAQGVSLKSEGEIRAGIFRGLEVVETALGEGPFLEQRESPGRGDLALGGFLPQMAYNGLMPWVAEQLLARPSLVGYVERVYAACGAPMPELR